MTTHSPQRPLSTPALHTSPLSTPGSTPVKRSPLRYSDRFIPSRAGSGDLRSTFDLLRHTHAAALDSASSCENTPSSSNLPANPSATSSPSPSPARPSSNCYSLLLKSELLDAPPRPPSLHLSSATPPPSLPASARLAAKRCSTSPSTSGPPSPAVTTLHPGLEGLTRLSSPSVRRTSIIHYQTQHQQFESPHTPQNHHTSLPPQHPHSHTNPHYHSPYLSSPALLSTPGALPQTQQPSQLPTPNMLRFRSGGIDDNDNSLPSTSPLTMDGAYARSAMVSAVASAAAASPGGRAVRKVARTPFKVLDAPSLKDDFYLNLVDWSSRNVLAVGLGSCVYLWSACTSVVTKLCDLQFNGPVCSVSWSPNGTELAVGTQPGQVQVWDTQSCKLLRTMTGHTARAGCLAWNSSILSSGGRDKEIFNRDVRARDQFVARLSGHKQEVCGLRWSPDETQLASGGNDNKLLIWSAASACGGSVSSVVTEPLLTFSYHGAAVKAIAWSPHARGLLASGGGTADRRIRFWNTMTNSALAAVDTGSQVCNLAWSKNVNELVSTHGYSQNQIIVWKYPSLSKVVTLMGHSYRVLYLAVSPSGETIVTGAGDETLRFWNVFPAARNQRNSSDSSSLLSPGRMSIR